MVTADAKDMRVRSKLQGLQFVRANAVLLVVVCHSAAVLGLPEYFDSQILDRRLESGAVGVDIFFALSGFIIIYVSLSERTLAKRVTIGNFALKRFERLIPFLWVAVIGYAIIRFATAGDFELRPYLNSLFLWPVGEVRPNVVWSLRHEVLFYALFAITFLLRRRAPYLLYLWCAAPIIVWAIQMAGVTTPDNEWFDFVFNRANAFFGCGVIVGLLWRRYAVHYTFSRPAFGWAAVIAGSVIAFFARDLAGSAVVAVAATLTLLAGLVTPWSGTLFARWWEKIGDASYSIYLTHNIALLGGATIWVKVLGSDHYVLAIPILGIAAVVFGTVVYFWVERPVTNYVRGAIDRRRHTDVTGRHAKV